MKRQLTLFAAGAALLVPALMGCNKNGETVNAANQTGQAAHKAADGTANATKHAGARSENAIQEVAKNITAAAVVTPKVSGALKADKTVSAHGNVINVDSKNNVVHLKGTVQTNAIKKRAGEIAQRVLTDNHSTDQLSNELVGRVVVHH